MRFIGKHLTCTHGHPPAYVYANAAFTGDMSGFGVRQPVALVQSILSPYYHHHPTIPPHSPKPPPRVLSICTPPYTSDIGANLLDDMYGGQYNDKPYHPPDLDAVLARAWAAGLQRLIITAGSLAEAKRALELAEKDGGWLWLSFLPCATPWTKHW